MQGSRAEIFKGALPVAAKCFALRMACCSPAPRLYRKGQIMQNLRIIVGACSTAALLAACGAGNASLSGLASGAIPTSHTFHAQGKVGPDTPVQFVYVTNQNADTVSGYEINAVGALTPVPGSSFATGNEPWDVVVNPAGKFIYVADLGVNNMMPGYVSAYKINPGNGSLSSVAGSPFPAGDGPINIAINPKGTFAYATNVWDNTISGYTINAATGALTTIAGSPFVAGINPRGIVVDLTGRFVYETNVNADNPSTVSGYSINPANGALTQLAGSPWTAGSGPIWDAVNHTNNFLYVTDFSSNDVYGYAINHASGALTPVAGSPWMAGGIEPVGVALKGKFAFVADQNPGGTGAVSAFTINATTGVLTPVTGSPFPAATETDDVAVSPAGHFVYATNNYSANVSAFSFNAVTGALTPVPGSPFAAGNGPIGIATCKVTLGKCRPPVLQPTRLAFG
jgi:6-phosphogluconolactonase (cycloisomerase 2 family)